MRWSKMVGMRGFGKQNGDVRCGGGFVNGGTAAVLVIANGSRKQQIDGGTTQASRCGKWRRWRALTVAASRRSSAVKRSGAGAARAPPGLRQIEVLEEEVEMVDHVNSIVVTPISGPVNLNSGLPGDSFLSGAISANLAPVASHHGVGDSKEKAAKNSDRWFNSGKAAANSGLFSRRRATRL
ncbi:hypothetical protein U1Q18_011632 [Sarracenia purpurea var. burkii]